MTCRKRPFPTNRDAIAALRHIRIRERRTREVAPKRPVRSYLCPVCGAWHLTSQFQEESE